MNGVVRAGLVVGAIAAVAWATGPVLPGHAEGFDWHGVAWASWAELDRLGAAMVGTLFLGYVAGRCRIRWEEEDEGDGQE